MKRLLILLALLISTPCYAQSNFKECFTTNGNNCVPAIAASNRAILSVSSATTSELVALVSGQRIYITAWDFIASAVGTIKLVYGTGTNCGTGTTDLTGNYTITTSTVFTKGNGLGPVLIVPASNALCYTSASTAALQGTISYVQF